jgi:hypothetical protein
VTRPDFEDVSLARLYPKLSKLSSFEIHWKIAMLRSCVISRLHKLASLRTDLELETDLLESYPQCDNLEDWCELRGSKSEEW